MVSVYSQIVQRKYKNKLDKDADQYLTFMVEGAQRMDMLVHDLLGYTQAAAIGDEEISPISTHTVLMEVLSNLQTAIRESGASINIGRLPETLLVKEVHLLQLFQNIIGNAIKYRGETPPVVDVQAENTGEMWTVCIHDNGIGIDPQYADQIFGIFKRLHTAQKYAGTGIGLAIWQISPDDSVAIVAPEGSSDTQTHENKRPLLGRRLRQRPLHKRNNRDVFVLRRSRSLLSMAACGSNRTIHLCRRTCASVPSHGCYGRFGQPIRFASCPSDCPARFH